MISFWIDAESQRSICVEEIAGPVESGHLSLRRTADQVLLQAFAQHLYVDVKTYLEDFLNRLASDIELQALVAENDERLMRDAVAVATKGLDEQDFIALGL
jgi:hypothetical protein